MAAQMIRVALLAAALIAACTMPKDKPVEIPIVVVPDTPTISDTRTPRKEPAKPRKAAAKPVEKPVEPEPVNPLAECKDIDAEDPKEAARARLDCITKRLDIE